MYGKPPPRHWSLSQNKTPLNIWIKKYRLMVCHIFWETPISCFIAAIPGISLVIFCFMVCHYQENHMFKTRVWSVVVVSTYEPLLYPLSKSVESLEVKDECHRLVATIATWSMRCALKGKAPVTGPFGEPLTKKRAERGGQPLSYNGYLFA